MKNQTGFSTIELMLSVLLVAICLSAGYPAYKHHLVTQKRLRAEASLLKLSQTLMQYHTSTGSYSTAELENFAFEKAPESFGYQFEIQHSSNDSYVLAAIPEGSQQKDSHCKTLTLNSHGEKGISGDGSVNSCWPG